MPQRTKSFSFFLLPLLALGTLILYRLLPYNSEFIELWYSRGLFMGYRMIWDYSFGLLPIGLIYLLLLSILLYLFWPNRKQRKDQNRFLLFMWRLAKVFCVGIISFYWLWAFNYKRSSFYEVTSLNHLEPNKSFVYYEYCRVTDSLDLIRTQIEASESWEELEVQEQRLRDDLELAFRSIEIPFAGRVRAIKIRPKGSLLHISTAGVYLPFVGQGHIDAGLHPITHPFTIMHEMSHGYGWTGEDVCNFLALLGTINSDLPEVRYSGYFGYWRYLRSQIYQIDKEHFEKFYRHGPEDVMRDYREILSYSEKYPDVMPILRDLFYDQYLKSHGIPDGLVNYSQMIILSYEWQEKYGSLSLDMISKTK